MGAKHGCNPQSPAIGLTLWGNPGARIPPQDLSSREAKEPELGFHIQAPAISGYSPQGNYEFLQILAKHFH